MWAETRHRNIEKTRSMNNLVTSKLKVTNNQGMILKMLFMELDLNDGKIFTTMEWLMVFVEVPL